MVVSVVVIVRAAVVDDLSAVDSDVVFVIDVVVVIVRPIVVLDPSAGGCCPGTEESRDEFWILKMNESYV